MLAYTLVMSVSQSNIGIFGYTQSHMENSFHITIKPCHEKQTWRADQIKLHSPRLRANTRNLYQALFMYIVFHVICGLSRNVSFFHDIRSAYVRSQVVW